MGEEGKKSMELEKLEKLEAILQSSPAKKQWEKIGIAPHHGVNVPLFSLHSRTSCGIGEYTDLIPLFPWLHQIGVDFVELLPLNDTGRDSSPYSCISAFALNPIHLGLAALPFDKFDKDVSKDILHVSLPKLPQLPNEGPINYSLVREQKEHFLRAYFQHAFPRIRSTEGYRQFLEREAFWLDAYALFKCIKEARNGESWHLWKGDYAHPFKNIQKLEKRYGAGADFHRFVQYLCFQQLEAVKEKGLQAGVRLKGDIPIACGAESADAWQFPEMLLSGSTAGAPPDVLNLEGQSWGFPLYDWEAKKTSDFAWWRERLRVAGRFYDLYRIDHVVGLYRIWAIPEGKNPLEGAFFPQDKSRWIPQGEMILRFFLENSPMLPIAEDLGSVPDEVRASLTALGICGTKVLPWERDWKHDKAYIPVSTYSPISISTVSTHDSETLELWWQHKPSEAALWMATRGGQYTSKITQEARFAFLRESHYSGSLFHSNLLHETLALFPELVGSSPQHERINLPGTVGDHNWTYRFIPSVEDLLAHAELATCFARLFPRR